MEYELKENGKVQATGTAQECWDALLEIYGCSTTIGELAARNIIIEPKQ
jgi:hypothetical protein